MLICANPDCRSHDIRTAGWRRNKQRYRCNTCGTERQPIDTDDFSDILTENVKMAKTTQKYRDKNRIANKSFREHARGDNAVIEYVTELREVVKAKKIDLSNLDLSHKTNYVDGTIGVVHLSDLHLNELVDVIGNKYDFNVAAKRLKMMANKVITNTNNRNIETMYIVLTGDLLNSDRRLDELLSMATNRAMASFLAVKLLAQFIAEIATIANVKVISVTGNESRIREEYTQLDSMATDNFDFVIYEMLQLYLEDAGNAIEFVSGNTFEYLLDVHGVTILIVHGHRLGKMSGTDLSKSISKWAKRGILVHYIMCGHLHEVNITDTLLRSGSLVGNNAYSDVGLNLHSHASQNFYFINSDGTMDAMKLDLQNVDDYPYTYDIDKDLEAYNTKSVGKIKNKKTIMEIII